MPIYVIVATQDDDTFMQCVGAYRDRASAEAVYARLTAEIENKRAYNTALDRLLDQEFELAPGVYDGTFEEIKQQWNRDQEVKTIAYMRENFPELAASLPKPIRYFAGSYTDYSIEEVELR